MRGSTGRLVRALRVERLESRQLLAGNVRVDFDADDGELKIHGDRQDNCIEITQAGNMLTVTGCDNNGDTTVNGAADATFDDVDEIRIWMRKGNDQVTLTDVVLSDDLSVHGEDGNDEVTVTGTTVGDDAHFNGGKGNDTLTIEGSTFNDHAHAELGKGNDTVAITTSTFRKKAKIDGDSGADTLTVDDATVFRKGTHRHSITVV